MEWPVVAVLIVLVLVLIWSQTKYKNQEKLSNPGNPEDLSSQKPALPGKSYIRLYEAFNQEDIGFEFAPDIDYLNQTGNGFYRAVVKMNLKSIDINLPKTGIPTYDQIRKVELWSVYPGMVDQSTESDFYNSYLEPDWALRANSAKYRLICRVLPGNSLKVDMIEPCKKVWVIASL